MEEIVATLLHTNRFQSVVVLTPSQGRFPWRGKLHRRGWPSSGCPDGPSCSPCRPIADRDGGSRACAQCGDLLACLCRWRKKRWSIFGVFTNNQSGLTTCAILQRYYTILFGSLSQWTTPYSNVPNTTKTNENVWPNHIAILPNPNAVQNAGLIVREFAMIALRMTNLSLDFLWWNLVDGTSGSYTLPFVTDGSTLMLMVAR